MATTVEILLDKASKTYYPGETIHGTIVVESNDERSLRLIKGTRLRCKGFSTMDLKLAVKVEQNGASMSTVTFVNEDAQIHTDKLSKTSEVKGASTITRCEYPFRFKLGSDLPQSFKTSFGRMEYFFKASVPSGTAVSYFEGKTPFEVAGVLDLNERPELKETMELRQEAVVKTLLTEGKVSYLIRLPRKAFAIGDKLLLHQEITNDCNQSVNASISMIQRISYQLGNVLRLDKNIKFKVFGKVVPANGVDVCDHEIFEIPKNLPITSVMNLKDERQIIKIEYFLKYEVIAKPLWLKKVKSYIPLVIGSTPFKD